MEEGNDAVVTLMNVVCVTIQESLFLSLETGEYLMLTFVVLQLFIFIAGQGRI